MEARPEINSPFSLLKSLRMRNDISQAAPLQSLTENRMDHEPRADQAPARR